MSRPHVSVVPASAPVARDVAVGWVARPPAIETITSEPDPTGTLAVTGLLLLADAAFAASVGLAQLRQLSDAARRSSVGPSQRPRAPHHEPVGVAWRIDPESSTVVDTAWQLHVRATPAALVCGRLLRYLDAAQAERLPQSTLRWSRHSWGWLSTHWARKGPAGSRLLTVLIEDRRMPDHRDQTASAAPLHLWRPQAPAAADNHDPFPDQDPSGEGTAHRSGRQQTAQSQVDGRATSDWTS